VETLLTVFFGSVGLIALIVSNAYFWEWYYAASTGQDETVFVTTQDGRRLALHHYKAGGNGHGAPVILCHGVSSNRYCFDLPLAPSLARFLAEAGRDVWVAELRGSGMSERPRLFISDVPYTWDFDDHLTGDVPAIIGGVLNRTGATEVHWVGHSMGGMLILAHLAGDHNPPVASAVTVGSPADFSQPRNRCVSLLMKLRPILGLTEISLPHLAIKLAIPFCHRATFYLLTPFHPTNMSCSVARRMLTLISEPVTSSKVWLQLGDFAERGVFGPDGGPSYLDGLAASKTPLFFIGGTMDQMAPPGTIRGACAANGETGERKCLILGKGSGAVEDYGHVDLLLGVRSPEEVFSPILEWLRDHDDLPEDPASRLMAEKARSEARARVS